jgi:Zn finger protein HypA/HybF involved in hydrogenase expression
MKEATKLSREELLDASPVRENLSIYDIEADFECINRHHYECSVTQRLAGATCPECGSAHLYYADLAPGECDCGLEDGVHTVALIKPA